MKENSTNNFRGRMGEGVSPNRCERYKIILEQNMETKKSYQNSRMEEHRKRIEITEREKYG